VPVFGPSCPFAAPHGGLLSAQPARASNKRAARLSPQFGGIPTGVNACDAVGMHADTVRFLREHAQTCTRLARDCPDRATAHGLEEVAISLAAKAEQLEREFELRS
jgi:hypothetical protein